MTDQHREHDDIQDEATRIAIDAEIDQEQGAALIQRTNELTSLIGTSVHLLTEHDLDDDQRLRLLELIERSSEAKAALYGLP